MTPPLTAWERAQRWLWPAEGGHAFVDQDTNRGVIQPTLDTAIAARIVPPDTTLDNLTQEQARAIYFGLFWTRCRCSDLPPALGLAVFDGAVNSGPEESVLWLQRALNQQGARLSEDGAMGHFTLAEAHARPQGPTLDAVLELRREYDRGVARRQPQKRKFVNGWMARIGRLETVCRALLPAEGKA